MPYLIQNSAGVWCVQRRVPERLQAAVARILGSKRPTQVYLKKSLATKDRREANSGVVVATKGVYLTRGHHWEYRSSSVLCAPGVGGERKGRNRRQTAVNDLSASKSLSRLWLWHRAALLSVDHTFDRGFVRSPQLLHQARCQSVQALFAIVCF